MRNVKKYPFLVKITFFLNFKWVSMATGNILAQEVVVNLEDYLISAANSAPFFKCAQFCFDPCQFFFSTYNIKTFLTFKCFLLVLIF